MGEFAEEFKRFLGFDPRTREDETEAGTLEREVTRGRDSTLSNASEARTYAWRGFRMRAHYFQHVPFEGLGSIESWFRRSGWRVSGTRFFEEWEPPPLEEFDLLVVMGGPMGVSDTREHPWLVEERHFIRGAVEAGKPVLGICLGAQLIAAALGAEVVPNPEKEIGWFPIRSTSAPGDDRFQFPGTFDAFHWHGDTFALPPGATRLAESDACRNQAFQVGDRVIGLQFHLETTPASARALVEHCGHELAGGRHVQSADEILNAPAVHYEAANRLMDEVLEYLGAAAG